MSFQSTLKKIRYKPNLESKGEEEKRGKMTGYNAKKELKEEAEKQIKMLGYRLISMCQKRKICKDDMVMMLPGSLDKMNWQMARVLRSYNASCKIVPQDHAYQMTRQVENNMVELVGRKGRLDNHHLPMAIQEIDNVLKKHPTLVNFQDWDRGTALMAASRAGAFEVVRHLIRAKANPGSKSFRNNFGETALHVATSVSGNYEVVRELLEGFRKFFWKDHPDLFVSWVNEVDFNGHTALMNASMAAGDKGSMIRRTQLVSSVYLNLRVDIEGLPDRRSVYVEAFDSLKNPNDLLERLAQQDPRLGEKRDVHHGFCCSKCKANPIKGKRFVYRNHRMSFCGICISDLGIPMKELIPKPNYRFHLLMTANVSSSKAPTSLATGRRPLDVSLTLKENGLHQNSVLIATDGTGPIRRFKQRSTNTVSMALTKAPRKNMITRTEAVVELLLKAKADSALSDRTGNSAFDFAQSDFYLSLLMKFDTKDEDRSTILSQPLTWAPPDSSRDLIRPQLTSCFDYTTLDKDEYTRPKISVSGVNGWEKYPLGLVSKIDLKPKSPDAKQHSSGSK